MDYQRSLRRQEIERSNRLISGREKWYLIETRGHRCEICGLSEWLNEPIVLILDHIDGNADNWLLGNLRLICSNCDSQTPTYKSKNKGNGRAWRRERYAAVARTG